MDPIQFGRVLKRKELEPLASRGAECWCQCYLRYLLLFQVIAACRGRRPHEVTRQHKSGSGGDRQQSIPTALKTSYQKTVAVK